MKKLLAAITVLFAIGNINSQNIDEGFNTKNEVGLVVSDLIDGSLQVKYERQIANHFSITLGIAYKGDSGLIKLSGLDTDKIKTNEITYSGFKIIPEFRYYLNNQGNNGMNGFYFGAYLKYSSYQSELEGTYINDTNESFDILFDGDIKVTSVGLLVGYKLPITKRLAIDFLIAGPGTGHYNFSLINKKDLPEEFYEDFNNALDQYSLFDLLNGDFRFESVKTETKFSAISFRYGISIGYSF